MHWKVSQWVVVFFHITQQNSVFKSNYELKCSYKKHLNVIFGKGKQSRTLNFSKVSLSACTIPFAGGILNSRLILFFTEVEIYCKPNRKEGMFLTNSSTQFFKLLFTSQTHKINLLNTNLCCYALHSFSSALLKSSL